MLALTGRRGTKVCMGKHAERVWGTGGYRYGYVRGEREGVLSSEGWDSRENASPARSSCLPPGESRSFHCSGFRMHRNGIGFSVS